MAEFSMDTISAAAVHCIGTTLPVIGGCAIFLTEPQSFHKGSNDWAILRMIGILNSQHWPLPAISAALGHSEIVFLPRKPFLVMRLRFASHARVLFGFLRAIYMSAKC
jgi:hypothetical protein